MAADPIGKPYCNRMRPQLEVFGSKKFRLKNQQPCHTSRSHPPAVISDLPLCEKPRAKKTCGDQTKKAIRDEWWVPGLLEEVGVAQDAMSRVCIEQCGDRPHNQLIAMFL